MNTLTFLNSFESENISLLPNAKFNKLRTELYSKNICWTDSIHGNFSEHNSFRVVLFLKNNNTETDYNNPIITECNGLVLEYSKGEDSSTNWKVLAVPTNNCTKTKISINQVNKFYQEKKYQIYEVLDATIINMYYYNNVWRISTCKGYDITDIVFIKNKSYAEVFSEITALKYPKFNMKQLDTNNSYTFAIRTPEFHLFNETKHIQNPKNLVNGNYYVKLIKSVNLNTLAEVDINWTNINIPVYQPIEVKNVNSISVLINYAKHSFVKYAKGFETNNFKFKPLYGYIIRSKSNTVPRAYRNIIITSTLFTTIKHGIYNNFNNSFNQTIINMFLDKKRKYQYKILFDQYASQFSKLDELITNISKYILQDLTSSDTQEITSTEAPYDKLSKKIINKITLDNILSSSNNNSEALVSIIYDYLHTSDYMDDLNELLT